MIHNVGSYSFKMASFLCSCLSYHAIVYFYVSMQRLPTTFVWIHSAINLLADLLGNSHVQYTLLFYSMLFVSILFLCLVSIWVKIFNFYFAVLITNLKLSLFLLCSWLLQNAWRYKGLDAGRLSYGEITVFAVSGRFIKSHQTPFANEKWKLCCSTSAESSGEITPDSLWEVQEKPSIFLHSISLFFWK